MRDRFEEILFAYL